MTDQQARIFVLVVGMSMVLGGAVMTFRATEDRMKAHGVKLGIVGVIFLYLGLRI